MLLAVALMPVIAGHWFHRNRNKAIVSLVLGLPTVIYVIAAFGRTGADSVARTVEEYASFILLLVALYTISGGIYLTGNLIATPRHNLAFLAAGALLANLIGTMGASMLLIRPLLRANSERTHARHTLVFFIFAVSNIGGMLTPLGDPPLFLGFLRGVPFAWTLRLWPQWLTGLGLVLLIYLVLEWYLYRREPEEALRCDTCDYVPMRMKGGLNFVFLALVIVTVLLSDVLTRAGASIRFPFVTEISLAVLTVASLKFGSARRAQRELLHLVPHRRGGRRLRGHLRHHDPGSRPARGARERHRVVAAVAVLLVHGLVVGLPGQRAHVPVLHIHGAGAGGRGHGGRADQHRPAARGRVLGRRRSWRPSPAAP